MTRLSNCSKDFLTPTRKGSVLFVMEEFPPPPAPPPERVEVIKEAKPLPGEPTPMAPPPPEPTPTPPKEE